MVGSDDSRGLFQPKRFCENSNYWWNNSRLGLLQVTGLCITTEKTLINFSKRTIKSPLRIGPEGKISFVTLAPKKCDFTLDFQRTSVTPVMYLGSVFGFTVNYSFAFEKSIGFLKIFRDFISAAVSSITVQLQWLKFCSHLFLNTFSIFFLKIKQKNPFKLVKLLQKLDWEYLNV